MTPTRVADGAQPLRTDLVDRLVRRDLLLLRLEAARGRRTARAAGVVGRRVPVRSGPAARPR